MNLYRNIPKVDKLLDNSAFTGYNKTLLSEAIKQEIELLRSLIKNGDIEEINQDKLIANIKNRYTKAIEPSLKPLINATGVIIHTNLGRSPIDPKLFDAAKEIATGYCNLEYNLTEGKRGDRYTHTSKALCELLGVEDALIVNNNAAAVFLILNTFAKGQETIVSRGELVEIGGSFRIPNVMSASGSKLIEVGTTNKTKIADYENAITADTAMLMKVHKSNYTIEGFSAEAKIEDIVTLAKTHSLISYYDLGSAYLPELPWGLSGAEPSIFNLLKNAPDLMSFSGDKLLGSVQAGIIVGKKELISKLKKNQILRMFRVDKITLALLERTILAYRQKEYNDIPILKMLFATINELEERAKTLQSMLCISSEIRHSKSYVGGGTMPNRSIPTVVLAIKGKPQPLEQYFRENYIIGRIEDDNFVLDLRTIDSSDFETIALKAESLGHIGV